MGAGSEELFLTEMSIETVIGQIDKTNITNHQDLIVLNNEVQWEMTGLTLTASIHTTLLLGSRVMAGERHYSLQVVG